MPEGFASTERAVQELSAPVPRVAEDAQRLSEVVASFSWVGQRLCELVASVPKAV